MFPVGVSPATAATIAVKNVKGGVLKLTVVVDIRNARQRHDVGALRSGKEETMEFANRMQAGRLLAKKLDEYANRSDVVVLALPRGGVPVACEVARALNAPLDVFLVRKLGLPGHEEFAMGAIASGGVRVMNKYVVQSLGLSDPG